MRWGHAAATGDLPRSATAAELQITRQMALFVGSGYLIYLILLPLGLGETGTVPRWWFIGAAIAVYTPGIVLLVLGFRGSQRTITYLAIAAGATLLLTQVSFVIVWDSTTSMTRQGTWFNQFIALPSIAWAAVLRWRFSVMFLVVVGVAASVTNHVIRAPSVRFPFAADLIYDVAFSGVFTLAAASALRVARVLDNTRAQTVAAARRAGALGAIEAEHKRFAALMHDGVMATLLAAARTGTSDALTDHARRTLAQLDISTDKDETPLTADEFVAQLFDAVRIDDPTIPTEAVGRERFAPPIPPQVALTLIGAATEAVRNVVRHAADAPRSISIRFETHGLTVAVADDGPGFIPSAVPVARLGISVSIRGRMDDLDGGAANIESVPGVGTRVRLDWRADAMSEVRR